jgi:hypothetical protein
MASGLGFPFEVGGPSSGLVRLSLAIFHILISYEEKKEKDFVSQK